MTNTEILNTILGIPGAQMARKRNVNFVIVPTEEGYTKVAVTSLLAKDKKNAKAFNAEAAVAEYKAHEAEVALREAEHAANPKKVAGPNPEAQARRDELDAKITSLPSFTDYTATDIHAALSGQIADNVMVMHVGQSAHRLVEKNVLTVEVKDKKNYYTKA